MVFLVYWGARRLRVNLDRLTWPHKLTCFSAETWDKTQGGLDIVTYWPVEARSPPNRKYSFPVSFLVTAASSLGGNTQRTSHL